MNSFEDFLRWFEKKHCSQFRANVNDGSFSLQQNQRHDKAWLYVIQFSQSCLEYSADT